MHQVALDNLRLSKTWPTLSRLKTHGGSHPRELAIVCALASLVCALNPSFAVTQSFFAIEPLSGDTETFSTAIIGQGTLVVGASRGPNGTQAIRWVVGSTNGLGYLPNLNSRSIALAVSAVIN